ncbi:hypothetical protein EMCRGX_G005664 [Ephydatia muelleri]
MACAAITLELAYSLVYWLKFTVDVLKSSMRFAYVLVLKHRQYDQTVLSLCVLAVSSPGPCPCAYWLSPPQVPVPVSTATSPGQCPDCLLPRSLCIPQPLLASALTVSSPGPCRCPRAYRNLSWPVP